MEKQIISAKLCIPRPRQRFIKRTQLFDKLDQLNDYKLAIISGGAGSGKTTLFSSYIQERTLRPLHWVSLDSDCNHLFIFWSYILETLSGFLGESAQAYLEYFHGSSNPENLEEILAALMEALKNQGPVYLVLDDFHLIQEKALLDSLDFFLRHMDDNIHVILLTRENHRLYLAKYEMDGILLLIDEQDLKLTDEEAFLFLKDTLCLPYSDAAFTFMAAKAEGWIGGLQLMAAASWGKDEAYITKLSPSNRFVKEYLSKEIYDKLTDSEKQFLTFTSALSYFNQPLCHALFPAIDFHRMIDSLYHKNLLIHCIDEDKGLFRYHNIMGEYLRTYFEALPVHTREQVHRTAAEAFLKLEDYEEGLSHLYLLKDYDRIMDQLLHLPQTIHVYSYFSKVPSAYAIRSFDFIFQKFFYHYSNYDFAQCRELYDLVESYIDTDQLFSAFWGTQMLFSDSSLELTFDIPGSDAVEGYPCYPLTKALILVKNAVFL